MERRHVLEYLSNANPNDLKYTKPETWPVDLSNIIKVDHNSIPNNVMASKTDIANALTPMSTATMSTLISSSSTTSSILPIKKTQANADASFSRTSYNTTKNEQQISVSETNERPLRRKLRSHRNDECNIKIENCLTSITNSSPVVSKYLESSLSQSNLNYLRTLQPVPPHIANFVQNLLTWHLLPSSTVTNIGSLKTAPSIIFGAIHLARLIGNAINNIYNKIFYYKFIHILLLFLLNL